MEGCTVRVATKSKKTGKLKKKKFRETSGLRKCQEIWYKHAVIMKVYHDYKPHFANVV